MFCQKCGKEIPNDANMCSYCGSALTANGLQNNPQKKGKKKNKKAGCLASIVVVAVALIAIIIVIAVSSGSDGDSSGNTTNNSGKIESSQEVNDTAKPIFEDEYIKASFVKVYNDKAVDMSVEGVSYMQLLVENKSNQSLTIGFKNAAINGMSTTIGSGLPVTVLPGNSSQQPFILFTKNTGVTSADDISKIQFSFCLMDENAHIVDETETVTINVK